MERIELKMNLKAWIGFSLFFFAFASITLNHVYPNNTILFILIIAFSASVISIGAAMGIFYFFQKEVVLTEKEIKKYGFRTKSIAYSDIQKIRVGTGGFSIYDKGITPINITTWYSNFGIAKKLLNQKIKDRSDIEIEGLQFYINKHLTSK